MFNGRFGSFAMWSFFGGFAAVLAIFALQGCGRRGDIIAIVDGQPIRMQEFYQYLQNKSSVNVQAENGSMELPVDGSLGFQALKDVIEQNAELDLARQRGLYPTTAEIDSELHLRLSENPNYLTDALNAGLTLDVVKKNITIELAQDKLLTQGISVSDAETDQYIRAHRAEFVIPEKLDLSYILVKSPSEEPQVDQDLNSGQAFSTVALKHSDAPGAQRTNGKLTPQGAVAITSLPNDVREAVTGLKEGDLSGWVELDAGGFARFFVDKLDPAKPIVMDAEKREAVRRELAKIKGSKLHNLSQMIADKVARSKVQIMQPEYAQDWRALVQTMRDEKK